jgi:hypothetical protein
MTMVRWCATPAELAREFSQEIEAQDILTTEDDRA